MAGPSKRVTVRPLHPFSPNCLHMPTVGSNIQLFAQAYDQDDLPTTPGINWSTTDAGVATVSGSGLVTAVASGICNIKATAQWITSPLWGRHPWELRYCRPIRSQSPTATMRPSAALAVSQPSIGLQGHLERPRSMQEQLSTASSWQITARRLGTQARPRQLSHLFTRVLLALPPRLMFPWK